jgi:hypothetical protein
MPADEEVACQAFDTIRPEVPQKRHLHLHNAVLGALDSRNAGMDEGWNWQVFRCRQVGFGECS